MALKGSRVPGKKVPALSPLAMAGHCVRSVCLIIHVTSRKQAPELNFGIVVVHSRGGPGAFQEPGFITPACIFSVLEMGLTASCTQGSHTTVTGF